MLTIKDVHAGYPNCPVLHGVDLAVPPGSRIAILGRNGVGKTTLARTIVGSVKCVKGTIRLGESDITRMPAHQRVRHGLANVPQGRGLFAALTVVDNLKVPARAKHGPAWKAKVEASLDEFPVLAASRSKPAGSLSGGQQQTLALARALVTEPRVLVLDEPTEGIQPSILDGIADLLIGINEQRGVTVVMIEQKLDFAARVADEAVVIERGRVRRWVAIDELMDSRELQRELLAI